MRRSQFGGLLLCCKGLVQNSREKHRFTHRPVLLVRARKNETGAHHWTLWTNAPWRLNNHPYSPDDAKSCSPVRWHRCYVKDWTSTPIPELRRERTQDSPSLQTACWFSQGFEFFRFYATKNLKIIHIYIIYALYRYQGSRYCAC